MNIQSIFDSKRFGRLVAHDLRLNTTKYLLMLSVFTLLLYLFLHVQMQQSPHSFITPKQTYSSGDPSTYPYTSTSGYMGTFVAGLIGLGLLIGTSFTGWGSKVKRMSYLQLPASTFEKYLHPFLVRFVGGTVLYFILYWLVAQLAQVTSTHGLFGFYRYETINGIRMTPDPFHYSMFFPKEGDDNPWFAIVMFFVSIAAYLFAAPLYFRKQALVKSILAFFVIVFLVVCTCVVFSHFFYPEQVRGYNVHLNDVKLTEKLSSIELAAFALTCGSWLFFLLIGFFKLKEMKV